MLDGCWGILPISSISRQPLHSYTAQPRRTFLGAKCVVSGGALLFSDAPTCDQIPGSTH